MGRDLERAVGQEAGRLSCRTLGPSLRPRAPPASVQCHVDIPSSCDSGLAPRQAQRLCRSHSRLNTSPGLPALLSAPVSVPAAPRPESPPGFVEGGGQREPRRSGQGPEGLERGRSGGVTPRRGSGRGGRAVPTPVWGGPGGVQPEGPTCALWLRGAWQGREHPSPTVLLLKGSLPTRAGTWYLEVHMACLLQPALTRKRRLTRGPVVGTVQPRGRAHRLDGMTLLGRPGGHASPACFPGA